MAETSSSTISRSPQKLTYTSSINTTSASPTALGIYHSSFDFISEPRDCDTLTTMNQDINHTNHRKLERNLRQLDIDSDRRTIQTKNKKLGRTESISLPTTPTEQISPSCEYKYPRLSALKNEINNDYDDDPSFSFQSSTDYMNAVAEQDFQQQIMNDSIIVSKR